MNRSLNSAVNGEEWLVTLLPSDAMVLDVGFNMGDFSATVVRTRPQARSIGFDPARSMLQHYQATYDFKSQVELVAAAVSNSSGICTFTDTADGVSHIVSPATANARGEVRYDVPQITLDAFTEERGIESVDFLKVDAEGYDLHVLEGASRLLDSAKIAMFMFEFNDPWILTRRFLQEAAGFLEDKPYRLFRLFNGFLVPFHYSHHAERHDLGCNYVGVSRNRLASGDIPIRSFP
jgi:FkbM family methyltransferase